MRFLKRNFMMIRHQRNKTLEDIALALGISKQTVSKWEKHPTLQPRMSKIPKLADFLGCKETDLIEYDGVLEKHLVAVSEEEELQKKVFFGADLSDELRVLKLALAARSSGSDPEVEKDIGDALRMLFVKFAKFLQVKDFSVDEFEGYRYSLIGKLIDSDLDPVSMQKVLKIIKNFPEK